MAKPASIAEVAVSGVAKPLTSVLAVDEANAYVCGHGEVSADEDAWPSARCIGASLLVWW